MSFKNLQRRIIKTKLNNCQYIIHKLIINYVVYINSQRARINSINIFKINSDNYFIYKGGKMINESNIQTLTHKGISKLFGQGISKQEYILQVLQVFAPKQDVFNVFLSDGSAWVKGQLVDQAQEQAKKLNLSANYLIRIRPEDMEIIPGQQYTFKLKSYTVVNSSLRNAIGTPVALADYKKKQNFITFQSVNMNSPKKYHKIKQIKIMNPTQLTATIFGKVVKKPDRINSVMNIMIEDQQKQQIQCCFFGDNVVKYRDLIQVGQWYYFQNPVLQMNNKFGNMQLKINNLSKVTKQTKISEIKPGIINYNNNNSTQKSKQQEPRFKQFDPSYLTQFNMKDFIDRANGQQYDKYIIARPLYLSNMKNGLARVYSCVDRFGVEVQILLWNDCHAQIQLNETYRFNCLKVKTYNKKVSLQSQKFRTQINISTYKILARTELNSGRTTDSNKIKKFRYLGSNDIVYSIREMKEKCQKSSEKSIFVIACGYLTIKFDCMAGNGSDLYSDLRKKLFYVHCEKCENNQYLRSKIEPETMNGKVVCNGCKSETIRILWNIKAVFMDSQTEVACKINSQIAQKLIEISPSEGMLMYLNNQEGLKALIQQKINFKRGAFKFSSKYNDRREGERFYNICQCYEDVGRIFAQRTANELKRVLNVYQEYVLNPDKIIFDQNPGKRRKKKSKKIQKLAVIEEQKQ